MVRHIHEIHRVRPGSRLKLCDRRLLLLLLLLLWRRRRKGGYGGGWVCLRWR
jgi:hypothetical protein